MTIKDKVKDRIELEGRYSQIPNKLFGFPIDENKNTSAIAERIWGYLFSCSRSWNPGQRQISDKLRISTEQVKKGLNALQLAEMLTIHDKGIGTRHEYELEDHKYWKSCKEETVSDLGTVENSVSDLGTDCHVSADASVSDLGTHTISKTKEKTKEKTRLDKKNLEELDFKRESIILKWKEEFPDKDWSGRFNSFCIVLGNLKILSDLERVDLSMYENDIIGHFIPSQQGMSKELKKSLQRKKINYSSWRSAITEEYNRAVVKLYSLVDLEDVEIKETVTPSVINVEEYIPPPSNKILTLEKLSKIGEDTIGPMEDRLDHEFIKLCQSVGEDSE